MFISSLHTSLLLPYSTHYCFLISFSLYTLSIPILSSKYFSLIMGVTVNILEPGDNRTFPHPGDTITVHYVGTLDTGRQFDSSRARGRPFTTVIGVGAVIKGWDEGFLQLSKGATALLTVDPDYGYGEKGFPNLIPPNSKLFVSTSFYGFAPFCGLSLTDRFFDCSLRWSCSRSNPRRYLE